MFCLDKFFFTDRLFPVLFSLIEPGEGPGFVMVGHGQGWPLLWAGVWAGVWAVLCAVFWAGPHLVMKRNYHVPVTKPCTQHNETKVALRYHRMSA